MVSAWPWASLAVFTFDRALSQTANPMIGLVSASRHSPTRALIAAVSAVAFALLVSIAATHLHTGVDSDEACAVCAAVIGKLQLRRMLCASLASSCRPAAVLLASHRARVGHPATAHMVYQRSLSPIRRQHFIAMCVKEKRCPTSVPYGH